MAAHRETDRHRNCFVRLTVVSGLVCSMFVGYRDLCGSEVTACFADHWTPPVTAGINAAGHGGFRGDVIPPPPPHPGLWMGYKESSFNIDLTFHKSHASYLFKLTKS